MGAHSRQMNIQSLESCKAQEQTLTQSRRALAQYPYNVYQEDPHFAVSFKIHIEIFQIPVQFSSFSVGANQIKRDQYGTLPSNFHSFPSIQSK